jgi:hypothetical protein
MYIHSTDSSCEKTKQEKQKNFSILLLKKQKKPWKNENCPMKKTTPQPSEIKKENLILTLCATNFYMPFVFFVMFYHTLLLPSTTLKKTKKNLVSYYVFLSFFFSSFRNFSYVLGKIAGKCWQWKETKSFPFLNSPLPMFHVNCEWWCWMDEIKFFFDT